MDFTYINRMLYVTHYIRYVIRMRARGWVGRLILLVCPAKCVSLTSLLFSKVFLVTKRPLLIVGCLPRFAATPLKFIKNVGLIHDYVTTHANLGNPMQFAWPNIVLLPDCEASAIQCAEDFGLYMEL